MKIKVLSIFNVCLLALISLLSGCQNDTPEHYDPLDSEVPNVKEEINKPEEINDPEEITSDDHFGTKNIYWNDAKDMDVEEKNIASRFAQIATSVEHVESAHTYVFRNTVFIALKVAEGHDDNAIIQNVRNACREEDSGKNFNIVSDYGVFDQMEKSGKSMRSDET